MSETEIIIIGAGLSGLAVAHRLAAEGRRICVLEARDRLGGRILSASSGQGEQAFDLGPAWIWRHNHRMLRLIADLGLQAFEQYAEGMLVYEDATGDVRRDLAFAPMAGALRINGALGRLINGLAEALPMGAIRTAHRVTRLNASRGSVEVFADTAESTVSLRADHVVIAVPPRVAVKDLATTPPLPSPLAAEFAATPTWMAGHAKTLAVYPTPFWRSKGLSGDAMSQLGPLAEIHDASPADGACGALFGFVGVPAAGRQDQDAMKTAAIDQLGRLFGPDALAPQAIFWQDWATEPATATQADWEPPTSHPHYRRPPGLDGSLGGKVIFAGTELAPEEGGFLEGALAAAEVACAQLST